MQHSSVLGASVLALLLVTTAAWADVTPEQVWQNWKELSTSYGQTLTTTGENRAGDTLTVTGVAIASTVKDASGPETETKATIDQIAFRDRGDGTVEITMSAQVPMNLTSTTSGEDPFTLDILIDQPGLVVVASAAAEETRYDFTAPTWKLTLTAPPSETDLSDLKATVELAALAGNYAVTSGGRSRISSDVTADTLRIAVNATDPAEGTGGTIAFVANASGLVSKTSGTIVPSEQLEDMAAALAAGFATDGSLTYAGADYSFDFTGADATKSTGSFGPGSLSVALDKDRMAYGGTASKSEIKVSGTSIPFPELVVSYGETAFDFLMPVSKSDAPQDFKAVTRIVDLAVSPEVWNMFDPTGALPRDPATLVVDTSGKARWLMDLMSPEAAEMESVPGELTALTVNELMLRAVGASVTGKGGFTFDNADMTTFAGMPAPTGTLDMTIVGANALLEKLSQSGLLPPDQVMGAKMMIGLFAKPGEGEDTLTSTVEFKDKGLFVNGQQLQ